MAPSRLKPIHILMTKRIVSMIPITRSWRGFSFPMTTPKEMRVQAAARPPSRTLENGNFDYFYFDA